MAIAQADIFGQMRLDAPNLLAVRVWQEPYESRWYPGAGIYRNVRLHFSCEGCGEYIAVVK